MKTRNSICPYIALDPELLNEKGVVWVQHNRQVLYWNQETRLFEVAEGPLLPEGWAAYQSKS